MKPLIYTKFGMINQSMEVDFCLYEKYEELRDIVKKVYYPNNVERLGVTIYRLAKPAFIRFIKEKSLFTWYIYIRI